MNKKVSKSDVKKNKYDDKEDLEIKKVAYTNSKSQTFLFYSLVIIFIIMLCYMTYTITNHYINKKQRKTEVIEVNYNKNKVMIINNGQIKESINNDSFANTENEIVIERINSIELISNKNATEKPRISYNVKYKINKNTFNRNLYSTSNSNLLVKFSYSLDCENWTYINNVISTPDSTINPLVGNFYDIAGYETTLNVITNLRLEAEKNGSNKVYWRSETVFKKLDSKNIDDVLDANFMIEYKEWN